MSQENVEIVRRSVDDWNETGGESLWELFDPDIEFVLDPPAWLAGTYRGRAQLGWLISRLAELFDEFRYEVDELLPAGDLVVSLGGVRQRGALSGATDVQKGCGVWELREGRIVRVRMYFDREEALREAGLAEEAMSPVSLEVRAMAEALNSGDPEAFLARTAEDVEFTSLVAEAEGRTFRGHAGVRAWWETVLGAFQDPRWEVLEVRGSGDRAVVKSRLTATLADTQVEQTMWMAARLREGKLGWWAFFRSEHEALEAVGLSE